MTERYSILLVGNNPSELANMNTQLAQFEKANLQTDVSFDLDGGVQKIQKNKPNYVFLDDCYPVVQLRKFIASLRNNVKTQDIPVALLKSSNKSQLLLVGIHDFLLKENFSGEQVLSAILNSRKIKRTHIRLYKSFLKGRNKYYSLSSRLKKNINSLIK